MTCYINLVVTPIAVVVLLFPTNPAYKTSSLKYAYERFFLFTVEFFCQRSEMIFEILFNLCNSTS